MGISGLQKKFKKRGALNYLGGCLMCDCVQYDVSVWSQMRKNECIGHMEKQLLNFESQMDEDAKL